MTQGDEKIGDVMCICARTCATIRQHADEEHKEQDPETRTQANLFTLM